MEGVKGAEEEEGDARMWRGPARTENVFRRQPTYSYYWYHYCYATTNHQRRQGFDPIELGRLLVVMLVLMVEVMVKGMASFLLHSGSESLSVSHSISPAPSSPP